jgi:hypothetical protein
VGEAVTEAAIDPGSNSIDLIPKNSRAARPCWVNTELVDWPASPSGDCIPVGAKAVGWIGVEFAELVGLVKVAG